MKELARNPVRIKKQREKSTNLKNFVGKAVRIKKIAIKDIKSQYVSEKLKGIKKINGKSVKFKKMAGKLNKFAEKCLELKNGNWKNCSIAAEIT